VREKLLLLLLLLFAKVFGPVVVYLSGTFRIMKSFKNAFIIHSLLCISRIARLTPSKESKIQKLRLIAVKFSLKMDYSTINTVHIYYLFIYS
jgi:hypothetical protein